METIQQVDLSGIEPPKKRRGRPAGSKNKTSKTSKTPTNVFQEEEDLEAEKRALKQKLLQYSDHNPTIVEKPINDKIAKLVNEMDIDELRARCRQGKKICSSRIDNVVGRQIIGIANQAVGSFLDCVDELQYSTSKDQLLNETTTQYFSLHLLDFVPDELKIGGIYASHVISAYNEAQSKKPENKPVKVEEVQKVEQQEPENPITITKVDKPEVKPMKRRDIEFSIGPVQETRDRLIKMKEDLANLTTH